jgi:hypothetical protein
MRIVASATTVVGNATYTTSCIENAKEIVECRLME